MATKTKKKRLSSNIQFGFGAGMDVDTLANLAKRNPEDFVGRVYDLIDEGKLGWKNIKSVQRLFHALYDIKVPTTIEVAGQQRAVMASAFPVLAGGFTLAALNEAMESADTIGEELVDDVDDSKKVTEFVSISSEDTGSDRVDEGQDYPEIGAGEERFEVRHLRNGRRLSITAETIEENDVAGIVDRINQLAELATTRVEKQTLRRVCDIDGSATSPKEPFAHRPNGAGAALYSTTANTPSKRTPSGTRINNNALVDTTDLDAARSRIVTFKDNNGDKLAIPVASMILLVPDALLPTALKIQGSTLEPGVENEINNWGPGGRWQPKLLSTPRLDDLSTTTWYLGDFKRQFVRKNKLRMEVVTLSGDTNEFLKSRIAFQSRIGWDIEIGVRIDNRVVQSIEATTAP